MGYHRVGRGLSPPARGSQRGRTRAYPMLGSIPARAGEPFICIRAHTSSKVYPRPRGGAGGTTWRAVQNTGLSPPARGSPNATCPDGFRRGSIPARAGEPYGVEPEGEQDRVYPRPRGGASVWSAVPTFRAGLSPPARGSPAPALPVTRCTRSIPARAGEPRSCSLQAFR